MPDTGGSAAEQTKYRPTVSTASPTSRLRTMVRYSRLAPSGLGYALPVMPC